VFILFGVLRIITIEFIIGTILYIVGLSLLELSIINYSKAPLDKPITNGFYRISRNPQESSLYIMFAGMILVIGSIICSHFSILGEESSLEQQYGQSYLEYKKKVARYFLFLKNVLIPEYLFPISY
jgi:protein-S-isoprenylcysteine O-methyltransferase Ste14